MLASALVYVGLVAAVAGAIGLVKPIPWLRIRTRRRAIAVTAWGAASMATGFVVPVSESRVVRIDSRLDEFVPVWQFNEKHVRRIAAPPSRVYDAVKRVRADEISFFRTLTWIRRGGRPLPESILNAGTRDSLVDVALRGGFVSLADDAPRELVIGTVVAAPPGTRDPLTSRVFQQAVPPPGVALAAMNFRVAPDGASGSLVSTETRVFASPQTLQRFAMYWRVIYPGSAIIRMMWLRAIERRAVAAPEEVEWR